MEEWNERRGKLILPEEPQLKPHRVILIKMRGAPHIVETYGLGPGGQVVVGYKTFCGQVVLAKDAYKTSRTDYCGGCEVKFNSRDLSTEAQDTPNE